MNVNNKKGFTLVEVIVVAVIVLILAAVAIPLYNGYVRDSRQAVADNIAGSLASLLGAAFQAQGKLVSVPTADANGNIVISVRDGIMNSESQLILTKDYSAESSGGEVTIKHMKDDRIVATARFATGSDAAKDLSFTKVP